MSATTTDSLPPLETVTPEELVALLAQINHAMPLSFTAITEVKARVKAWVDSRDPQPRVGWSKPPVELGDMAELRLSPYEAIFKLSRVQAMTGADFEASVQRQQDRECAHTPAFQAGERQWGSRISSALVHKVGADGGRYYLVAHVLRASRPVYLARGKNGLTMTVSKEQIAPFLPPDRVEEEGERQGVERPIVYRNYLVSNLAYAALLRRRLRIRGGRALPVTLP